MRGGLGIGGWSLSRRTATLAIACTLGTSVTGRVWASLGENLLRAAKQGFATATDLADYLVRKGLPFRDAHEVVGHAVRLGLKTGRDLAEMTLAELQGFSPLIEADVFQLLTLEGAVATRNHFGGTAPEQVRAAVTRARAWLTERES
jgi:argininosuccinate lyase